MKLILPIAIALSLTLNIQAQQLYRNKASVNFGLTKPMAQTELPYSKASLILPERVSKVETESRLLPVQDNVWEIAGGWELAKADDVIKCLGDIFSLDYGTGSWYDATVPGTVLTTLVQQGVYPDPFFGVNNLAIPDDLCRKEWWYRAEVTLPGS